MNSDPRRRLRASPSFDILRMVHAHSVDRSRETMRVMDLTRATNGPETRIESSVAVDFLISLLAHASTSSQGTFEVIPGFDDGLRTPSSVLRASLEGMGPSGGPLWGNLVGLAHADPSALD